MKTEREMDKIISGPASGVGAAPMTLEGASVLHQMFRIRRYVLRAMSSSERKRAAAQAAAAIAKMEGRKEGQSAAFAELGHKGDLMLIHFRRNFDEIAEVQHEVANLLVADALEPTNSYLSMVEIGLYEATVQLYRRMAQQGVAVESEEGKRMIAEALEENRVRLANRLWPQIPDRRYVCFYPMNKRRGERHNWYQLSLEQRQRLMHEHGMIGRRYAGQVTQIISGSVGFDDWEWGVDLFADDPLVFKKLVYEMRFDESSALYGEFGRFEVAIRLTSQEFEQMLAGMPET
jgi:peroxiredoxin